MLLALDTATTTASIALFDVEQERLLAETTWQARRRHTQDLTIAIDEMMRRVSLSMDALSALAVTTGPGSFTGVRIGISMVKGIGLGLQHEPAVVGVPTLAVTAAPWIPLAATSAPPVRICAYIQAGRGRYNWAWFGRDDLLKRPGVADHHAGTAEEFAMALRDAAGAQVWLIGEMDAALQAAVAELSHVTPVDAVSGMRRSGNLARIAAMHLSSHTTDTLAALQPL